MKPLSRDLAKFCPIFTNRLYPMNHVVGFAEHFGNGSWRLQESHDADAEGNSLRSFLHGLL